jgi:SAM-dependent methyltransferase
MAADNPIEAPAPKRPVFVARALRELWRLAADRPYRYQMWLRLTRSKGAFQPFATTHANRYPRIFQFVQEYIGVASEAKILSYGCSTGEEVFSLRDYFSRAAIKGIDINPGNIAVCRRRLKQAGDGAMTFEAGDSTRAEPAASYDAIFCMAVLRHGGLAAPGVTRCDHLIRFEDFAKAVADFSRCLKPGGLLVIRYSNFRLCDTPAAVDFETILRVKLPAKAKKAPLFDSQNQLMKDVEYLDTVFRKIERID